MKSFKDVIKEKQERAERENRPKVDFFKLKENETRYIRFVQEFDEDMRNYDSKLGKAAILVEHTSADEWTRKAVCSYDSEGRCYACEKDQDEPSREEFKNDGTKYTKWHPWGQKSTFYVYVVDKNGSVEVLSRPTSNALFDKILEEIKDNDNSILGVTFRVSKGKNKSDSWDLKALKESSPDHFELPELPAELPVLEDTVGLRVAYSEQKKFYSPNAGSSEKTERTEEKTDSTRQGEDW